VSSSQHFITGVCGTGQSNSRGNERDAPGTSLQPQNDLDKGVCHVHAKNLQDLIRRAYACCASAGCAAAAAVGAAGGAAAS